MKPASLLSRSLAFLIDLGLWGGPATLLLMPLGFAALNAGTALVENQEAGQAISAVDALVFLLVTLAFLGLVLVLCVLFDAYCYRFERRYGATLGKGILGISVRDAATGGLPSGRQCVWREVTRVLEVGLVLPAMIAVALDSRARRLGDRIAGTEVVEGPSELEKSRFPLTALPAEAFRSRAAKGPAPYGRRFLAFLADLGVFLTIAAPLDIVEAAWTWAPFLGHVVATGDTTFPEFTYQAGIATWLELPLYFVYEYLCRVHFGDTVGRKILGLRRNGVPGLRFALVPFLLMPLTFVEGIVRTILRKPGEALADRLGGSRYVDVR